MNTGLSRAMQSVLEAVDTNADASAVWRAPTHRLWAIRPRSPLQIQAGPTHVEAGAIEERHIAVNLQRGIGYEESSFAAGFVHDTIAS